MTRRVLLVCMAPALLCCSCTRTTEARSESAFQAAQQEETRKTETITETVQTGPSTTTVYRFAPPEKEEGPARDGEPISISGPSPVTGTSGPPAATLARSRSLPTTPAAPDHLPAHGPLVEMTVIQTGPVLDTKRQIEKEASSATQTVQSEAKSATKTKTAPALSGYLWGVLAAVAVCGIGWVAWKMSPFSKVL